METFTIGHLAKKAEVNIETIRYYERRGLMPPPQRRTSGYRQYTRQDVRRMQFIKRAKELGFSLKEISELLSLRIDPGTTCGDIKKLTEVKISFVEEKIQDLLSINEALHALVESCCEGRPTSECPVIEALEKQ